MAQLRDTLIQGSARVTDTLYTNKINLADATASLSVFTDANKNLITKSAADTRTAIGVGASGTHADSYFVQAITSTDNNIPRFDSTAGQLQGSRMSITDNGLISLSYNGQYPGDIQYSNAAGLVGESWLDTGHATNVSSPRFYWRVRRPKSTATTTTESVYEQFRLPAATAGTAASATYEIITTKNLSNITSVGTITSGVWNGSAIPVTNGGTGATTFTSNCVIVGNGTSAIASCGLKVTGATDADVTVTPNTSGKILTISTSAANLFVSSGSTLYLNRASNASIVIQQASTEIARFNQKNNLQLGDTNATQNIYKLYVNGNIGATGKIAFNTNVSTEKASYQYINSGIFQRGSIFTAASSAAAGGNATDGYTGARWIFNLGIATPADGDIITIKVPVASHDYGTYISTDNGTTYKPIGILGGTTRLTGQYGVNTILTLAYDADGTINSMFPATGGSTARSNISGGCWRVINTVSTADEKVKVAANITTAADYPVVFANSNKSTTAAETAGLNKSGTKFYFNPSTGLLTATQVANAIWNDYAEYRKQLYTIQPGYVIKDTDSGYIVKANERLIPGAQIVSDTWGHSMGKTDECQTPVAVAGRVLAYTYRSREQYHAGMAVCSAPGGTIDIMTREEIRDYPDAIIGIVSEIPDYEEWGSGKVKVDGRIWIKVR